MALHPLNPRNLGIVRQNARTPEPDQRHGLDGLWESGWPAFCPLLSLAQQLRPVHSLAVTPAGPAPKNVENSPHNSLFV